MNPSYDDLKQALEKLLQQMPGTGTEALKSHVARPEIEAGRKLVGEANAFKKAWEDGRSRQEQDAMLATAVHNFEAFVSGKAKLSA